MRLPKRVIGEQNVNSGTTVATKLYVVLTKYACDTIRFPCNFGQHFRLALSLRANVPFPFTNSNKFPSKAISSI